MPVYAIGDKSPVFEDEASNWIAPDATVIGDVRIGKDAGIWFGVVIRGDNEPISIGARTNVQEHVDHAHGSGLSADIGAGCTIGHRAMLHGCTIGDNSLVGMGAIVLNGARIGRNWLVGAGALVTEGKDFRGQFADRRRAREGGAHSRRRSRREACAGPPTTMSPMAGGFAPS